MRDLILNNTANIDLVALEDNFIKYLDVKEKTVNTYKIALKQFFNYTKVNGINKPSRDDIISYRESLIEKCKPNTIQSYLIALRQFFKWTDMLGLYPNITNNVKGVKIDSMHKRDALTINQAKDLVSNVHNIRDYALLSLMITCGLRTIEVERANIEDIQNINGFNVLFLQGKGRDGKSEFVKLPNQVFDSIKKYLLTRKDNNNALFVSDSNKTKGQRLVTRSIRHIVKQHLREIDLDTPRLSAHSLRHTAITLALMNDVKLEEVQQFARHKNINTTQIYAHNLQRINNECENKISQSLFS